MKNTDLKKTGILKEVKKHWQLYALMLPALLYFLVFCYFPMYGVQIAFKDYKAVSGISGSAWAGLKHFQKFFSTYSTPRLFKNTILLNFFSLLFGFPAPILLAIMLNQIRNRFLKRFTQAALIVPHFISVVVIVGMIQLFLSPSRGILNAVLTHLNEGMKPIDFMLEPGWFRPIYIISEIWQNSGWTALIYTAALNAVEPALYEAAEIDGANRWQKIRYIDLPHLIPTAISVLILSCGAMLTTNVDKTLLLQTAGNISVSDVLGVYVYNVGIASGRNQYSYAAAVGLIVNVLNFGMLLIVNWITKKNGGEGLL